MQHSDKHITSGYSDGSMGVNAPATYNAAGDAYPSNSSDIFDEDERVNYNAITLHGRLFQYVPFGFDNQLPFNIIRKVGENMVMAQNKLFNALTCYGQSIRFFDTVTMLKSTDKQVCDFYFRNQLQRFFMEQIIDMKYFYFTISVIILNADGSKIIQIRHKEACYCRFERADSNGRIGHVFYANWRNKSSFTDDEVEVIELLDDVDPFGDLRTRLGYDPDPLTGFRRKPMRSDPFGRATRTRKFAIVTRFPTPGFQYYPTPFYASIFRDAWYDIYMLIGKGKRAKIRNSAPPRFQVEIASSYWDYICESEGITDPSKRKERIRREKDNIEQFICGSENSGKTWITGFYVDPMGNEVHMVKINDVSQGKKEGGDWSDDVQEASNTLCYGEGIHPNLAGATPGKSAMNNSGSDKRELFLLKQATETAFHDILTLPYRVIIQFNNWSNTDVDIPMIVLTTLDENKEKKTVKPDPDANSNGSGGAGDNNGSTNKKANTNKIQ